jgi:large subunit ribosomal protein L14
MIQVGTILNVIDNSGARKVICIKVMAGYRRRYAFVGDLVMVSVRNLRTKRKSTSKVKKGEIYKALVVRTKNCIKQFSGENLKFFENSVVLLNKQNKFIGTRIFGALPVSFRYTKYLRVLSLSNGTIF